MPNKITQKTKQNLGISKASTAVSNGFASLQAWSQNPKDLETQIEFSQSPGFKASEATLTNVTAKSVNPAILPTENYAGNSIYTPGSTAPLVYRQTSVIELTSSSTNGTATFDLVKQDLSESNYFYVVYRNTGSALAAGDLQIILRDSVTPANFVTLTSQKTASQGEWVYELFKFQEDGTTGVSFSAGTPDFSTIEIDLVLPVSGDTLQVAVGYASQVEEAFPVYLRSTDLGKTCLESIALELNAESFEKLCALNKKDVISLATNPEFTFTVQDDSLDLQSMAWGTVPKAQKMFTNETITFEINSNVAATGSAVGAGNSRLAVTRVVIPSTGNVASQSNLGPTDLESYQYYLNTTTGDITFATGVYPNGTEVEVTFQVERVIDGYATNGDNNGVKGYLTLGLEQAGSVFLWNYIVKIMPSAINFENEQTVKNEYMIAVLSLAGTKKIKHGRY